MYNLSLSQDPVISRDQLRQQIKEQVQQATTQARQATQEAAQAARAAAAGVTVTTTQPGTPGAPEGIPTVAIRTMPWDSDMPLRVKDVSIAFIVMFAAIIIMLPIMRAIGKRIERGAPVPMTIPAEMQSQMQHLMQSVDAIAIEVERISEGQRFTTKMLSEKKSEG
jgi:hypothetical protein